jgi:hypothetical protein
VNDETVYALIDAELKRLRTLPYPELAAMVNSNEAKEIRGADGQMYQLEIGVFWDSRKGADVRVMVSGDDGGWRAFKPLTRDFIMSPDGKFVGE